MFYYNEKICKECGGNCCKFLPGCAIPEDIIKLYPECRSLECAVEKALLSGKWSIDWYEARESKYFLRPAINYKRTYTTGLKTKNIPHTFAGLVKTGKDLIFDPAWHGHCIFLTDKGCKLSKDYRPDQCKRLKPKSKINDKRYKCKLDIKENVKLYYARIWKKSGVDLEKIGNKVWEMK